MTAERAVKKQKLLEAKAEAAAARMEALEHRSKQQAAVLEDARAKRKKVEGAWEEAEARAETLAQRLVAVEAAAADARMHARRAAAARVALADEADSARDETRKVNAEVRCMACMRAPRCCQHARELARAPLNDGVNGCRRASGGSSSQAKLRVGSRGGCSDCCVPPVFRQRLASAK